MNDMRRDDEFAEIETTNAEFEAMWASGVPSPFESGSRALTYRFSVAHTAVVPVADGSDVGLISEASTSLPALATY